MLRTSKVVKYGEETAVSLWTAIRVCHLVEMIYHGSTKDRDGSASSLSCTLSRLALGSSSLVFLESSSCHICSTSSSQCGACWAVSADGQGGLMAVSAVSHVGFAGRAFSQRSRELCLAKGGRSRPL